MSDDVVIRVEGLGKKYLIGQRAERERYVALRDVVARGAKRLRRKAGDILRGRVIVEGDTVEEFWALKDVNFEVRRGEVLGIIGRNGAGKSTLLKILSRITEPSEGRVEIKGRVASLLEVGTGFHPELTGRENIYLNGAILGMSRAEIREKFEEIVAFAEIEKFLDTPVKRYSSGMYVRLAFAVAAHLDPAILVVDEVLAVGDAEFQKKCLGKMNEVARGQGRTVLFVSHNLAAIGALCTRAILLGSGKKLMDGPAHAALDAYRSRGLFPIGSKWQRKESLDSAIGFTHLSVSLDGRQPRLILSLNVTLRCVVPCAPSFIAIDIRDRYHNVIMQSIPDQRAFIEGNIGQIDYRVEVYLPLLIPGVYFIDAWVGSNYDRTYDYVLDVLSFEVSEGPVPNRTFPYTADHGAMVAESRILCPAEALMDVSGASE